LDPPAYGIGDAPDAVEFAANGSVVWTLTAPVAPTRPLHVGNSSSVSMDSVASSSYASTVLVIFHSFPASVPGPSYARGSGPVNSW
jgi:hypothetical protein